MQAFWQQYEVGNIVILSVTVYVVYGILKTEFDTIMFLIQLSVVHAYLHQSNGKSSSVISLNPEMSLGYCCSANLR